MKKGQKSAVSTAAVAACTSTPTAPQAFDVSGHAKACAAAVPGAVPEAPFPAPFTVDTFFSHRLVRGDVGVVPRLWPPQKPATYMLVVLVPVTVTLALVLVPNAVTAVPKLPAPVKLIEPPIRCGGVPEHVTVTVWVPVGGEINPNSWMYP